MMVDMGTPDPGLADEPAPSWEQAVAEFEAGEPGEVVPAPQTIMVIYQYLAGKWHAYSPSIKGFEAQGRSFAETRAAVRADLGGYLHPLVALDERVWHPWQVTTQIAGPILVIGTSVTASTATGTLGFQPVSVTPPQTKADDRTTVVIEAPPSTLGHAA
jgi:predicted RNase H-like HicB family nuclease